MTYQPSVFKRYRWQTFLRVYIQDVRYKAKINWHRYGTNYVTVTVCIPPEWFCVPCPKLREMHQQLSGRPNHGNKTTNQVHMCTFERLNESLRRGLLEICGVSEHFRRVRFHIRILFTARHTTAYDFLHVYHGTDDKNDDNGRPTVSVMHMSTNLHTCRESI